MAGHLRVLVRLPWLRPLLRPTKEPVEMLYSVVRCGQDLGLQCARCGMVSWNPTDLREAYCANCGVFLKDQVR